MKRKDLFAQTFDKAHQRAVGSPSLKTYTIRLQVYTFGLPGEALREAWAQTSVELKGIIHPSLMVSGSRTIEQTPLYVKMYYRKRARPNEKFYFLKYVWSQRYHFPRSWWAEVEP